MRRVVEKGELAADEVDDVLQLIALELVRYPERIPPRGELEAWLRGVARHKVLDHAKKERRRARREVPFNGGDDKVAGEALSGEELLQVAQSRAALGAAVRASLAAVEPRRREVLVRHAVNGEAIKDIAAATGSRVATCRNRLRLARIAFKRELSRRLARDRYESGGRGVVLLLLFLWCEVVARLDRGVARLNHRPPLAFALAATLLVCSAPHGLPPPTLQATAAITAAAAEATASIASPSPLLSASTGMVIADPGGVAPAASAGMAITGPGRVAPAVTAGMAIAGPGRVARAAASVPVPVRAPAKARAAAAAGVGEDNGERETSERVRRRHRDLALPRAWIAQAQRAVVQGEWEAACKAIGEYDLLAPDNPFAAARAGVMAAIVDQGDE